MNHDDAMMVLAAKWAEDDAASMFSNWTDADRFIPTAVYSDGTIYRGVPRTQFTIARDTIIRYIEHYIRTFHPEHEPRCYVEPTTEARCMAHTQHDARTTPIYRNAIEVY